MPIVVNCPHEGVDGTVHCLLRATQFISVDEVEAFRLGWYLPRTPLLSPPLAHAPSPLYLSTVQPRWVCVRRLRAVRRRPRTPFLVHDELRAELHCLLAFLQSAHAGV